MTIWYAIYCSSEKEQKFLQVCQQHVSKEVLQDAFVFTYDRMRRYEGAWHLERQKMFPGYVFLESGNPGQLIQEMRRIPYLDKILVGHGAIIPLKQGEELFLRRLCGEGHHFGMSRGYIQNGRTFVTEGPLQGQEQLIRKIDRHKRVARVRMPEDRLDFACTQLDRENARDKGTGIEMNFPKGLRELQMGLEIVSKS
ncbi:MAG: antiterminator LoaP [Lachnospiraceae bacterium]|nr:antiterminator LoaP [Lachnospiraceae bacterium]